MIEVGEASSTLPQEGLPYLIHPCDDYSVIIGLALGSDCGFCISHHVGQFTLAHIAAYVCQTGKLDQNAFNSANTALIEQYPFEDIFEETTCTAVVARITPTTASLGWIGSEEAFHIRQGRIIARTYGHVPMHLRPNPVLSGGLAFIPYRYLSSDPTFAQTQAEFTTVPWDLEPKDILVFLTVSLLKVISVEAIPNLIEGQSAPQAAQALMKAGENHYGDAAIVVRIG